MNSRQPAKSRKRFLGFILVAVLIGAVFLRFWRLETVPPGWRDDELINSLVISQHVLDGELAVYYADASGHEALYHALNAVMLGLFGPGAAGIRWLSAILGSVTVLLTFLLGRRLFGEFAGLVAAAGLAVSFWSLMYSRTGIRHILLPALALTTFLFFFRGLGFSESQQRSIHMKTADFLLAGFFMGLSFYSYFASRGVPLILLAFLAYALIVERSLVKRYWKQLLLMFGLAFVMAVPLMITLSRQPESEARVSELAVPLVEARTGNFEPLQEHVVTTISMFHAAGDDEWLYNIPDRPVFGPLGALFFWSGVVIALIYALRPAYDWLSRRGLAGYGDANDGCFREPALSAAFVLLWWMAGIFPAFISVPPASLGHTILAQPAVYLIVALPIWWLAETLPERHVWIAWAGAAILIAAIAVRDLPDYFREWPQRGMTRFLYRADIHDVAQHLNEETDLQDFAISGLLAGPWDKLALQIGLDDTRLDSTRPRWYDPRRALILSPEISFSGFPVVDASYEDRQESVQGSTTVGGYQLRQLASNPLTEMAASEEPVCFENGLCWLGAEYDVLNGRLDLVWAVGEELKLPPLPLISNPPPPGVYAGQRLLVFAQLQDDEGNFLVGDDGFWVDPQTLRVGDRFVQEHRLPAEQSASALTLVFGLYDPMTNERILTEHGSDHISLELEG